MGHIHPNQLIWKVYIFVFFEKEVHMLMYCSKFMLKIYICKYCEIGTCDDDMCFQRYVGVLRIYIYHIQQTCCIVHVFAFTKSSKLHDMSSFCCITYC